jgi:hypothetical protein
MSQFKTTSSIKLYANQLCLMLEKSGDQESARLLSDWANGIYTSEAEYLAALRAILRKLLDKNFAALQPATHDAIRAAIRRIDEITAP